MDFGTTWLDLSLGVNMATINVALTYAELKGFTTVNRFGTVIVLGRFSPADGDGGIWWWNASDTRADNGTTVLAPT